MTDPPRKLLFRLSDQKWALAIASLIAIVVYLLAFSLKTAMRIGLAYDLAVATFLALQVYRISRITAQDMRDYLLGLPLLFLHHRHVLSDLGCDGD